MPPPLVCGGILGQASMLSVCILYAYWTCMPPPLVCGGIKWCFWLTSDVCLSRTSGLTREQRPRKTKYKLGTEVAHITRDSDTTFEVKGQGHQAAILSAALTREAGAAVTVRTYWAWETTATLRMLGGVRGTGAPTGVERDIVSPRAQLLFYWVMLSHQHME